MGFDFSPFQNPGLDEDYLRYLLDNEFIDRVLAMERLWSYYRNELHGLAGGELNTADSNWAELARPYTQDQEFGLPARITGLSRLGGAGTTASGEGLRRKEVVVENDIGWRIDTGVHFLFGKSPLLESLVADAERARAIEAALTAVWEANGGVSLLQELALLGSVYGFADVIVRPPEGLARVDGRWIKTDAALLPGAAPDAAEAPSGADYPAEIGPEVNPLEHVRLEPVEAWRALPILDEDDYRIVRFYVLHYRKLLNQLGDGGRLEPAGGQDTVQVTEMLGADWWQYYEDEQLVAEGPNLLGQVPVVHIQNLTLPGRYEGAGDVEPLIPLQDELNTRLSDRAHRVTFQSFKMYLGRGIENFENRPVAPGRMWATDNPEASIEEFGGDASSPSEDAHIAQLREALDKTSGVTPLVAGLLQDRLGNLTSATALKVTLMGTLARVERKRITYGEGLVRLNRLILSLLDRTGIFPNAPEERRTRLRWPSPLPENQREALEEARMKLELGVPRASVLKELGYAPALEA